MGKRVLVVHAIFNALGGAEFLTLKLAKALKEDGFDVTILSCTRIDAEGVREIFGIDISEFNVVVKKLPTYEFFKWVMRGRGTRLRRLMLYDRLFTMMEREDIRRDWDLVIETQSNQVSPSDISYIHYPHLAHYVKKGGKGIHWAVYDWMVRRYVRKAKSFVPGRVLTNSSWTAGEIYKVHGVVADVVYPPVDVEFFSKVASNDRREKVVVSVGRFSIEKRMDRVVDVASKLRDYTFVLVGTTHERSHEVLSTIEDKVRKYRLDNVIVKTNLSRMKLLELLGEARYYLHPEYVEHFGISVAEAMAAGVVPFVLRDGGAWHDIVSRLWGGLGYRVIEEVVPTIRLIDSDANLYKDLRERCRVVANLFRYERFRRSVLCHVRHVLRVKEIAFGHNRS